MKNKLIILAVLAMCLCAGAPAWAANLVLNGDFESPGIEEAAADNWTHVSVNAGWNKTENNGFGTFHLVIGNGSACDGRCEQVVSASAGTNYQLSFQYNRDGWGNPSGEGRMEYLDSGSNVLGSDGVFIDNAQVTSQWTTYTVQGVAPSGTESIKVVMENKGSSEGTFRCDNVVLEALTNPTVATSGSPSGGVFVNPATTTELTWVIPTNTPDSTDVYFVESNDSNDLDTAGVYFNCTACESASVTLSPNMYYIWRVVTTLDGDPNQSADWFFNTVNTAPTAVVADPGKNHWLVGDPGSVDIELDGSGSFDEDGYPGDPLTYTWTNTVYPTGGQVTSIVAEEISVAPITAAGTYVFQLVVGDGVLDSVADTVTVEVFSEADSGLVGHWQFEDNLDATVGNIAGVGMDAEGSSAVTYSDGSLGKALKLDGTNWVELPGTDSTSVLGIVDEISLSAWVKTNTSSFDDWTGIVTKGDHSWRIATAAGDTAQFAAGHYQDETGFAEANGSQNIEDGQWHHIVGTHDGVKAKVYIDGVLDATADVTIPLQLDTQLILFGGNAESPLIFDGQIDEVRIFDRGLSADLVVALYASEGGGTSCGQNYAASDFNQDCKTDHEDLLLFVAEWLDCTDLTGVNCGN